ALAEVENARVLTGPLEDALSLRGQPLQKRCRVLVAAVLGPEQREDGELEMVRVSPQQLLDTVRLPVGETESAVERLFRDLRQVPQCIRRNRRGLRCVTSGREPPLCPDARDGCAALGLQLPLHQGRGAG